MALINCKECGKEMSDTLKKCPHCGYINKDSKNGKNFFQNNKKLIIIIGVILVVCIVGIVVYNKKIEQDIIQAEIEANTLTEDEKLGARAIKSLIPFWGDHPLATPIRTNLYLSPNLSRVSARFLGLKISKSIQL